ncbi:unnamed protein product [Parajaminaea phylloscopi]
MRTHDTPLSPSVLHRPRVCGAERAEEVPVPCPARTRLKIADGYVPLLPCGAFRGSTKSVHHVTRGPTAYISPIPPLCHIRVQSPTATPEMASSRPSPLATQKR